MGRLKIKKKEAVIPFRETLAYRMILLSVSILFLVVALYQMIVSFGGNTTAFIVAAVLTVVGGFGVFYNLDHLRDAKISPRAMQRMKMKRR